MLEWGELRRRRGIAAFVTGLGRRGPAGAAPAGGEPRNLHRPAARRGRRARVAARPAAPDLCRAAGGVARRAPSRCVMAVLLLSAPLLSGSALVVFLAAQFIWEGVRRLSHAFGSSRSGEAPAAPAHRHARRAGRRRDAAPPARERGGRLDRGRWPPRSGWWRSRAGWLSARVISADLAGDSLIEDLHLTDIAEVKGVGDQLEVEAALRAPIDRGWVIGVPDHAVRHSRRPHGRGLVADQGRSVR